MKTGDCFLYNKAARKNKKLCWTYPAFCGIVFGLKGRFFMNIYAVRQQIKLEGKSFYDLPLRVTYYARVSTEMKQQLNSLDNQIAYY